MNSDMLPYSRMGGSFGVRVCLTAQSVQLVGSAGQAATESVIGRDLVSARVSLLFLLTTISVSLSQRKSLVVVLAAGPIRELNLLYSRT